MHGIVCHLPDSTMGLLTVGRPLSWEESKKYVDKVRHDGVAQFIAAYKRLKDRKNDELKFGDEVLVHACVLVCVHVCVDCAHVSLCVVSINLPAYSL